MDFLKRYFGQTLQESPPLSTESDEVYPVHTLDDTKTFRSIIVTWALCFNDVLDADKLHTSLTQLLEIGEWRKLGGRLRLKVSLIINYLVVCVGS